MYFVSYDWKVFQIKFRTNLFEMVLFEPRKNCRKLHTFLGSECYIFYYCCAQEIADSNRLLSTWLPLVKNPAQQQLTKKSAGKRVGGKVDVLKMFSIWKAVN